MTTPALLSNDAIPRLSDWSGVGAQPIVSRPPTRTFAGDILVDTPIVLRSGEYWACAPGTVFHITKSLSEAVGMGTHGGSYGWTWDGAFFEVRDATDVIVDSHTVVFDSPNKYQGHEGGERGYNAWGIYNSSNVRLETTVLDADSALFFGDGSHHNTAIVTMRHPKRTTYYITGEMGHYGVKLASSVHDNLLTVNVDTRFFHDVSLTGNANLNVITGKGRNVNFDFHRTQTGAHHNLITDFDVGLGARLFDSSGSYANPLNSGPWNVWWGCRKSDGSPITLKPRTDAGYFDPRYVFLGHHDSSMTATKEWLEAIPYADLSPKNLYAYQCGAVPPPPPPVLTPREQARTFLTSLGATDMVRDYLAP